jgi:ATP-dependent Clp protease ATP-binding subunit ClpA
MADMSKMTDWDKLKAMLASQNQDSKSSEIDEEKLLAHLQTRVRGQDSILRDVAKLIRLSWLKEKRDRPICNLLFVGPTGTGKTEMAKAIAEYLFGDESAMLRFDCSELKDDWQSMSRLIGTATGYRGQESGGQLTRPMLANPRRVVLFDEIEKAHPGIMDLFLQMMGEGRLTERSSGKTADFTQAIVILTSNAQAEQLAKGTAGISDPHELINIVKSTLADSHSFRPEILGRIDRVFMFKPLEGMVVAEITIMKIAKLGREYGLVVDFVAPELIMKALENNVKVSRFGIRELERIVFELFANQLAEARAKGVPAVSFAVNKEGEIVCTHKS